MSRLTFKSIAADWSKLRPDLDSREHWAVIVRVDRCISWLEHAERVDGQGVDDADSSLIFRWIAMSALISKWVPSGERGLPERKLIRALVARLIRFDSEHLLAAFLRQEASRTIRAIASDRGLDADWWASSPRPPEPPPRTDTARLRIAREVLSDSFESAAYEVLERIYVARCQLVHGAASCNSKLNRDAVEACDQFLCGFLLRALRIILDKALHADWSGVLYPPPAGAMPSRGTLVRPRRGKTKS